MTIRSLLRSVRPVVAGALVLLLPGCVVEGICLGDGECEGGRVCRDGECRFECTGDEACGGCRRCVDRRCTQCCRDGDCEAAERCVDEVCVPAPECLSCATLPQGTGACWHGVCLVASCLSGWSDANGDAADGCEYACTPTDPPLEVCDGTDNDCDGRTDEGFALGSDRANCGQCGHVCPTPPHAEPVCAAGTCHYLCLPGFYEVDGLAESGCESTECTPTAGGVEVCDLRDNDCDGLADEDIVKTSTESCGPLCTLCALPAAEATCLQGDCAVAACVPGWHDVNGVAADGCEYACVPTVPPGEVCDGIDNDCDGLADEGLLCTCPEEMVLVEGAFCIDRYEASRADATATSAGVDASAPTSRAGVKPWSNVSHDDASTACAAAGKRLCTSAEFEQACRGPDQTVYCYGDTYDPLTCNGIDTYWPSFHPDVTGFFPGCTNEYGVFDINGNLWERIQGGLAAGGAFNCSDSEALHRCDYRADWGTAARTNFGFRCCL